MYWKTREKVFMELTFSTLRLRVLIINIPVPQSFYPAEESSALLWSLSQPVLMWTWGFGDDRGLSGVWWVPTKGCWLITMGTESTWGLATWGHLVVLYHSPRRVTAVPEKWLNSSKLRLWACWFQGQRLIEIRMTAFHLSWMQSVWSSGFDLKEILQCRLSDVQKNKQRSLRSSDLTPKITSKLSVSPYSEIARWLKPVTGTS